MQARLDYNAAQKTNHPYSNIESCSLVIISVPRQELAEQSTRRDLLMKEQSEKNNRCKRIEEEIFELCGSENFDDDIKRLEEEIKVLQGSKGGKNKFNNSL